VVGNRGDASVQAFIAGIVRAEARTARVLTRRVRMVGDAMTTE